MDILQNIRQGNYNNNLFYPSLYKEEIDENQSIEWNREQNEKQKKKWLKELHEHQKEQSRLDKEFEKDVIIDLLEDYENIELNEFQAKIIFKESWLDAVSEGLEAVYFKCQTYADFYEKIIEAKED